MIRNDIIMVFFGGLTLTSIRLIHTIKRFDSWRDDSVYPVSQNLRF